MIRILVALATLTVLAASAQAAPAYLEVYGLDARLDNTGVVVTYDVDAEQLRGLSHDKRTPVLHLRPNASQGAQTREWTTELRDGHGQASFRLDDILPSEL